MRAVCSFRRVLSSIYIRWEVSEIDKPKKFGQVAKRYAKGYSDAGASVTKRSLKGFTASSGSPNEDINWNNLTLRQRSRMLYMASPVATSAIDTNRTKVVGTGLTLKCSVDRNLLGLSPDAARDWQQKTEAEFALWAEKAQNCDAIGQNNFAGLQQLAVKTWLASGDAFAAIKHNRVNKLQPYGLRVHLIEADRISTPDSFGGKALYGNTDGKDPSTGHMIYDGVEVDGNGQIVAYHIRNTYPNQITAAETVWTRVEAYGERTGLPNILQIMDSERPDQYRGVPYLSKVVEPLLQLRRFTESELIAALIQSFFTAWIKTTTGTEELPFNEVGAGDVMGVPSADPDADNISRSANEYELGSGVINVLEPDEDVVFGNPNIPSTNFDTFVKVISRFCGAAMGIPYDVLLMEFNSSYSAARAALLEAWEGFKMRRTWLVGRFCQPVYEVWLHEAVARGRIKAPGFFDDPLIRAAWCGANWIGPVQGSLDPLKEAKADLLLIDAGIKTHAEVTREKTGGDWDVNVATLALENEALTAAGGKTTQITMNVTDEEENGGNEQG